MYDGVMDAATYVRVQSIFFEVSVVFSHMVTHYALGRVADVLVPSSSLLPVRCARGTASTSPVPPCYVLLRHVYRGQLRSWFRRAGPPPASPSFVVFLVMLLESLFFLGAVVPLFWLCVVSASRSVALRFVPVLWSAYFPVWLRIFPGSLRCGAPGVVGFRGLPGFPASTRVCSSRLAGEGGGGRGVPTPVGVGILQGHFILSEPLRIFISFRGEVHPEWNLQLYFFKQKRNCTQSLSGLPRWEEARISHQSNFLVWTVCSYVLSLRVVRATARDPHLRSTKGEGGVYGGQNVSRLPLGRDLLARQAF